MRILGVAAITATLGGVAAAASNQASRIVDRTVLCKTWGAGYPDPLRVLATAAAPSYTQATNGPTASPKGVVAQIALGVNGTDQVVLSRVSCVTTRLRIPLSTKKLRGGAADAETTYRCSVPATVLIRIRAAFRNPVALAPAPDATYLMIAKGRIDSGSLSVTTKNKIPVSSATVKTGGKVSLFVAQPRCNLVD